MRAVFLCLLLALLTGGMAHAQPGNPLRRLLRADTMQFGRVLRHPAAYRVQVLYTQIRRDARGRPHFRSYGYRVRPREYFYPASTVKLPVVALALEKINSINQVWDGHLPLQLTRESPLQIDSAFAGQMRVVADSSAHNGLPTLGNYVRKVLLVSDNDAYNRLYEFVGQADIAQALRGHGLHRTRIISRLSVGDREPGSRHTNPFTFFIDSTRRQVLYRQPAAYNPAPLPPLRATRLRVGHAWQDGSQRINQPFDFTNKNFFPLRAQQQVLRALLFPEAVPRRQRFKGLRADDYQFLRRYLSLPPRQSQYPAYDSVAYPDNYAKFLLAGGAPAALPAGVRIYNKIGQAYGFLIDNAYIADEAHGVEFLLSAVIYVNADGVLNDDHYDYDTIGFPFLRDLGRAVYEWELRRKQPVSR
ncbi:serine hydrolase [Hymenobacter sp. BT507]|uniref:beta-lactamase n=1 Tax=Hymenobacter citatus TaxID=2763506 RepID=A0ABR7MMA4_9BACT|nr:serine hydrolase [Hymenobacter citatus]MBC6612219.1 serine hydrolase [Hymenobacter citatus]